LAGSQVASKLFKFAVLPYFAIVAARRGSTIRNSVKFPGVRLDLDRVSVLLD
jgi:hypothetical protein